MDSCPFCKLDPIKTKVLGETNHTIVILSNPALVYGHTLIVPRRHIERLVDLSKEEREDVFLQLTNFEEILLRKFSGCDIRQNYRPFIPQSEYKVNHLHFHLLPREPFDELYERSMIYERGIFKFLDKMQLESSLSLFGGVV